MSVTEVGALAHRLEREDPDLFLGKLFWYSFADVRVPHDALIRFLMTAGITKSLPLVPEDDDVFKRVCSKVKRTKVPTGDPHIFHNYLMPSHREFRDNVSIARRVVRETVDAKGRKLSFLECADIVFDRKSGVVTAQEINSVSNTPSFDTPTAEIVEEVIDNYETWRGCMNTYGVREWVRAFIQNLGATSMRPGGALYFVKMEHSDRLERLENFARLLTQAECGTIEFDSVPLIDDRKQRELLQRAFEAETAGAIETKLAEIAVIAGGDKAITPERYAKIVDEFQALAARSMDYETLLQEKLQATDARLKIFKKSLINLMEKVETTP